MELSNLRDIIPTLLSATREAKIQWRRSPSKDGLKADIGRFTVEIEAPSAVGNTREELVLYLWDDNGEIISSLYGEESKKDSDDLQKLYHEVLGAIRNVPGALNEIMSILSSK